MRRITLTAVIAGALLGMLLLPASGSAAKRPLLTGFHANPSVSSDDLDRMRNVNAGVVRIIVTWSSVAPERPSKPANPNSRQYEWGSTDRAVRAARARGLQVLLLISRAPDWAEGKKRPGNVERGAWKPRPSAVGAFGRAIAQRYSGRGSQPRVRDFQLWNEPNLVYNLAPQWRGRKARAPFHYRRMLNAFYNNVHKVRRSNRVVVGGTSPYGQDPGGRRMRPAQFWREAMCIKGRKRLRAKRRCRNKARFDVFAHHPINTSGAPGRKARHPDDVSTPDLHKLVRILRKAERANNVGGKRRHPVWATELWWETNPPDPWNPPGPAGNPSPRKQARWYAESFYRLWKQGASMVMLLQVRDDPYDGEPGRVNRNYQSGVFLANGEAKPAARAMRFPFFVDRKSRKRVLIWGKAPSSGRLVVKRAGKGKPLARFKVKRGKVFSRKVSLRKRGKLKLQARVAKQKSLRWVGR